MKRKTERKLAGFLRIGFAALAVLLQVALLVLLMYYLQENALWVYIVIEVIGLLIILTLVSRNHNSAFTIAWILVIALLPVFGQILYLMWGRSDVYGKRPEKIRASIANGQQHLQGSAKVYARLEESYPTRRRTAEYLQRKGFPAYEGTACSYYALGEAHFDAMIADFETAERFIFISTFILNTGVLWDRIRPVLVRKAAQGVEIRLMFDDFGSLFTAPDNLISELAAEGIQARRFGPVHMFVSKMYINYRNHQKITVIDGRIAYTGGTNIADEYINAYPKHGHWKDTAIRMEGDAAWSMTVIFLQMWDGEGNTLSNYEAYRGSGGVQGSGFFQPFADGPVNNPDNPAEVMYCNLITGAQRYVYMTTPYLVIDNIMIEALCTAALSGVDVRIIVPKVWDHWYVRGVSRSNYKPLLLAGVRIYEYTPGFIHAKTILSDGDNAVMGSINMDYRSFHAHFENGVWICGAPVLAEIKRDLDETLRLSEEVTLEAYQKRPWYRRAGEGLLRIFAVLM